MHYSPVPQKPAAEFSQNYQTKASVWVIHWKSTKNNKQGEYYEIHRKNNLSSSAEYLNRYSTIQWDSIDGLL